jgi:hypothetical protein
MAVATHAAAYVQYVDEDPALDLIALITRLQSAAGVATAAKDAADFARLLDNQSYGPLLDKIARALPATAAATAADGTRARPPCSFSQCCTRVEAGGALLCQIQLLCR